MLKHKFYKNLFQTISYFSVIMIFETFLKIIKRNGAATPGHLRIPETYEMARELADYIENLGIEEWK